MLSLLYTFACTPDAPDPLQEQRTALRAVERDRIAAAVREALDSEQLLVAAQTLGSARADDPDGLVAEWERLNAMVKAAPPGEAARAHGILYEYATRPEDRAAHRQAASDAAARFRYLDSERAITVREQVGVRREMGVAALKTLAAEYVEPLDESRLLSAMAHRLGVLTEGAASAPSPPLLAGFEALCDQAVERGLPETTAVAELTEAAFEAADSYSAPIWPAQVAAWRRHHDGVVEGRVGIQLGGEGPIVVEALAEGGSAWSQGVHVGDTVTAVVTETGKVDASAGAEALATALRGPNGTSVTLMSLRDGKPAEHTLERRTIAVNTVLPHHRVGAGFDPFVAPRIALIRIAAFRPHTLEQLESAMPDRAAMDGLVLDLRGNGGGDLASALAIADRFLANGAMLTIEGRVLPAFEEGWAEAEPGDAWEDLPVVVLVDRDSASSSEVLTAALATRDGVVVLGERTAGKGTSQVLRTHEELGFAMQFTNLGWSTPAGQRIHRTDMAARWGIEPDVRLSLSPLERFVVGVHQSRREALAVHADGSPMPTTGPELDPSLSELGADPQIAAALRALQE